MRTWNGDSRGRWEGNTLVVDITNYNDKGSIATNVATQRVRAIPQSEELHVVERCRLTRTRSTTADRGSQSLRDALESGDPVAPEPDYQIFGARVTGELGLPNAERRTRARQSGGLRHAIARRGGHMQSWLKGATIALASAAIALAGARLMQDPRQDRRQVPTCCAQQMGGRT